jgi:hypothetical protein
MSLQAIATFIDAGDFGRYQNGKVGASIVGPRNLSYRYLSFIYQGAAKSRSGDNLQAALVLANGQENVGSTGSLTVNIANELVTRYATVTVDNCLMNPSDYSYQRTLTSEVWLVSSFSYDPETVELVLSSSLDAIGTQAPTRVLTRKLVGALPTTGSVRNL